MIIGVDIGSRNLAIVGGSVDDQKFVLRVCRLVDLGRGSLSACIHRLVDVLDEMKLPTEVLIEQQHAINQRAYALGHALLMYYASKRVQVRFRSAVSKFNRFVHLEMIGKENVGRGNKAARKRLAIQLTRTITTKLQIPLDLDSFTKKDDIADAFLYCFAELMDDIDLERIDERRILRVPLELDIG